MKETSPYIFEVDGNDEFQQKVIEASHLQPVLVDFWADWCAPCRSLMPVLSGLAETYQGKFHLVKVNSDEQQSLAEQYQVRSLPTVKLFRHGQVVDEFMGALPESAVKQYIDRHIVRASDAMRQRARELLDDNDFNGAQALLEKAIEADPDIAQIHIELARLHIAARNFDAAEQTLDLLDRTVQDQQEVIQLRKRIQYDRLAEQAAPVSELEDRIRQDPGNLQARSELAARFIGQERYREAMDQYLEIMTRDRSFGEDAGRKSLLDVFNLLGNDNPLVTEYRRKMASLLY